MALFLAITVAAEAAEPSLPFKKNNAPIDITADALEVLQADNRAIFTGHVVVIQGDVRLKSEKMVVHYRRQEADEAKAKTKNTAQQDAIRKIEVEQDVFLVTPQETASGASGIYDVEKQVITLDTNVVLTRAKNTLKGDHLAYDMRTSKSVLTSDTGKTILPWNKPRVRALFVPDKEEKKAP